MNFKGQDPMPHHTSVTGVKWRASEGGSEGLKFELHSPGNDVKVMQLRRLGAKARRVADRAFPSALRDRGGPSPAGTANTQGQS